MVNEIKYTKNTLSDNSIIRKGSFSPFKTNDSIKKRLEHIENISNLEKRNRGRNIDIIKGLSDQQTVQILDGAYQEVQKQYDDFKERMKGTPEGIARNLSYQQ